jgi:hypothetical protein
LLTHDLATVAELGRAALRTVPAGRIAGPRPQPAGGADVVEQNVIAALHLSDRAIVLDMGRIVFDGTAKEVIENAELRRLYLAL